MYILCSRIAGEGGFSIFSTSNSSEKASLTFEKFSIFYFLLFLEKSIPKELSIFEAKPQASSPNKFSSFFNAQIFQKGFPPERPPSQEKILPFSGYTNELMRIKDLKN